MIIEPRIRISDEEFVALGRDHMDFEVAMEIVSRVQRAVQTRSFNIVQIVRDHVTNPDSGQLEDAGELEIRTDPEGNKL